MSADTDYLTRIAALWESHAINATIPVERLFTDDLPANRELPYAQVNSELREQPEFEAPVGHNSKYLDHRTVTVTVLAVGKLYVGTLIDAVLACLSPDRMFDGDTMNLRQWFFRGDEIQQDVATKDGNRVYRGVLTWHASSVRVLP